MYNPNYNLLRKITVELQIDKSIDELANIQEPASSGNTGYPTIKLKVRDKGSQGKGKGASKGEEIIDSEINLDPTDQNSFIVSIIH